MGDGGLKIADDSYVLRTSLIDTESEIYTMARWAKYLIKHNKKASIGCIIPNLNELRSDIVRIFSEVFSTDSNYPAFNVSSGDQLFDVPIIYSALAILQLAVPHEEVSIDEIGYVVRSPFLGGAIKELSARVLLEFKLRKIGNCNYTLSQLIYTFSKFQNVLNCSYLFESIENLFAIENEKKRLPSAWVKVFLKTLEVMGWPGDRALNSAEHQAEKQWISLLSEFSSLDLVEGKINYAAALRKLKALARKKIFQPQTTQPMRVQVLGMLEAVGLQFTHTWIMGLDDNHWPAAANPNPFLPFSLQRDLDMPHAGAKRELKFCQRVMQTFIANSSAVMLSYARLEADQILKPSYLICHYPEIALEQLNLAVFQFQAEKLPGKDSIEVFLDEQGPFLGEHEIIQGGTSIFKEQARCPFRAFARFRLHAENLEEPSPGLTLLERGSIIHKALELLWENIRSHQALLKLTDNEITNIITDVVRTAIKSCIKGRRLADGFIALEKGRLQKLINEWLIIEKSREPFEVLAIEKKHHITINGLPIHVKIDRIDHSESGHYILIDYKSGKTDIKDLFGERLIEPQLPLYAVSSDHPIHAISYAQIRAGEIKFNSVSMHSGLLPKDKTLDEIQWGEINWKQQLLLWRNSLQKIAQDFCQGKAAVDPINPQKTCQYCYLRMLCRY